MEDHDTSRPRPTQRRDQPGPHQRRLAAPRRPGDDERARASREPVQAAVDLGVAAEERVRRRRRRRARGPCTGSRSTRSPGRRRRRAPGPGAGSRPRARRAPRSGSMPSCSTSVVRAVAQGPERVGLAAAAVERQRQDRPPALPERLLGDERPGVGRDTAVLAGVQPGVEQVLLDRAPQLLQARRLAAARAASRRAPRSGRPRQRASARRNAIAARSGSPVAAKSRPRSTSASNRSTSRSSPVSASRYPPRSSRSASAPSTLRIRPTQICTCFGDVAGGSSPHSASRELVRRDDVAAADRQHAEREPVARLERPPSPTSSGPSNPIPTRRFSAPGQPADTGRIPARIPRGPKRARMPKSLLLALAAPAPVPASAHPRPRPRRAPRVGAPHGDRGPGQIVTARPRRAAGCACSPSRPRARPTSIPGGRRTARGIVFPAAIRRRRAQIVTITRRRRPAGRRLRVQRALLRRPGPDVDTRRPPHRVHPCRRPNRRASPTVGGSCGSAGTTARTRAACPRWTSTAPRRTSSPSGRPTAPTSSSCAAAARRTSKRGVPDAAGRQRGPPADAAGRWRPTCQPGPRAVEDLVVFETRGRAASGTRHRAGRLSDARAARDRSAPSATHPHGRPLDHPAWAPDGSRIAFAEST